MRIAIIAITENGIKTANVIQNNFPQSEIIQTRKGIKYTIETIWTQFDGIVCIMATGIVIRCISGLIKNKKTDPCLVVVDEKCQYAVSLLSGHLGGGNELANNISKRCGAEAVITTASDVSGHTSVDLWTVNNNLEIVNGEQLTTISARLLENNSLKIYQKKRFIELIPEDFIITRNREFADIVISLTPEETSDSLQLIPKIYYIGLGCRAGVGKDEFIYVINDFLHDEGIDPRSVAGLASIDIKKEEKGLIDFAHFMKLPIRFFSKEEINKIEGTFRSQKVYEKIGAHGVSEPAAVLAASEKGIPGRIIVGKKKWKTITAAVAVKGSCTS